jgi:hypothetical protein
VLPAIAGVGVTIFQRWRRRCSDAPASSWNSARFSIFLVRWRFIQVGTGARQYSQQTVGNGRKVGVQLGTLDADEASLSQAADGLEPTFL